MDEKTKNTKLSHEKQKKPKLSPEELKKQRQIYYKIYQLKLRSRYLFGDNEDKGKTYIINSPSHQKK
jgi:hypothetical protein